MLSKQPQAAHPLKGEQPIGLEDNTATGPELQQKTRCDKQQLDTAGFTAGAKRHQLNVTSVDDQSDLKTLLKPRRALLTPNFAQN